MRKTLLLLATMSLGLLLAGGVALAAGDLDPTFGGDGRVTLDIFLGASDHGNASAIQSDGKIVVAGTYRGFGRSSSVFALARFNPDGSVDPSFGSNGRTLTAFPNTYSFAEANAVAIQRDGKIVVAGDATRVANDSSDFALARYNPNGTLDTSFSEDGMLATNMLTYDRAYAVAVQRDGKIVAAGRAGAPRSGGGEIGGVKYFAVARYNPNGTPDTSFGKIGAAPASGHVLTHFEDAWVDEDGAYAVTIQPDGKIVAAGFTKNCDVSWPLSLTQCHEFTDGSVETDFALVRYDTNGSADESFGGDGKVVTGFGDWEYVQAVAVQANGKIVAAGSKSEDDGDDFALARYNTNGSLDTTFSGDGRVETFLVNEDLDASAVAIQWGGKIVAAGSVDRLSVPGTNFALARYYPNGTLDTTFDGNGLQTTDFGGVEDTDIAKAVVIQRDRRIVAVGSTNAGTDYDFALARYNP